MSDPCFTPAICQGLPAAGQEMHPSPELRTLLIRMAEVWDALAVHTNRIAAERAAAEEMPDAPLAPDRGELGSRVRSPALSPSDVAPSRRHEYND